LKPRPIVIVDARNVQRSRWPNIPDDDLVRRACAWAEEAGADALVVFDGRAPEGPGGPCEVVGSGAESADDSIIRAAGGFAAEGRPYWLVTSDRALRAAAGLHADRVIGGGSFAGELLGENPRGR
jgi:hypothetical protein